MQTPNPPPSSPSPTPPDRAEAFHRVTDVLRCKWTLAVLEELARGTSRPSELQRALPGLTSKVLSERLRKLERFGLVDRTAYPEVPPRVEYTLTQQGRSMSKLVTHVADFVSDWAHGNQTEPKPSD